MSSELADGKRNGLAVDPSGGYRVAGNEFWQYNGHFHPCSHHSATPDDGVDGKLLLDFMYNGADSLIDYLFIQREQYDQTPKVPLIIGLSALLLVILTIIWLVVYRKIRRRQRRRTIGVRFLYCYSDLNLLHFEIKTFFNRNW